jgi:hypothetical protein
MLYPELPQYGRITADDLPKMYMDLVRYSTELKFLLEQRDAVLNNKPTNNIISVVTTTDVQRPQGGNIVYSTGQGNYQVYVVGSGWESFSGGSGQTAIRHYGSFYDDSTQVATTVSAAYVVSINNTQDSFGVSLVSGTNISFGHSGVFLISAELQAANSDPHAANLTAWLRKNGADLPVSGDSVDVTPKHGSLNGRSEINIHRTVSVSAGDYIQVVWHVENTTVVLTPKVTGTTPVHPFVPSVVIVVVQV